MEELDTVYLSKCLDKYSNEFTTEEQKKYFCIGYLVAQGYAFVLAEHITDTIY